MNTKLSTALIGRPERPFRYACPVRAPDGSVGYDRPLENYFDTSMAPRLLPSQSPGMRLYDTVARAHDHRFQVSTDMLDPSAPAPRPLLLNQPERRRSLAKVSNNSPDYLGISFAGAGWRPRRSSYEDRRGSIGVPPSDVNTLVPYIPPIDTSMPPPSKEWLDAKAKQILANTQADIEAPKPNATTDATDRQPSATENDFSLNYDTDGSVELVRVIVAPAPPPQQEESSPSSDPYSDTDTDTDTDEEYVSQFSPSELCPTEEGRRWLIPRRRRSVEPIKNQDVAMEVTPAPSDKNPTRKRGRGRGAAPKPQVTKTSKRNANDTPARRTTKRNGGKSDPWVSYSCKHTSPAQVSSSGCGAATAQSSRSQSITAVAMEVDNVRIEASPKADPQLDDTAPLKSNKPFPCLLDGCPQVCASSGDLYRHQQSLRHCEPSYLCSKCGKSYTRQDALKRHLKTKTSCKGLQTPKAGDRDPTPTEANTEAS